MNKLAVIGLAAVIGLQWPALAADKKDPVIAKIGGAEIVESELELAESSIDPKASQLPPEQRRLAALSALIDAKVIAAKAKVEGMDKTADYRMRLQFLVDRELHNAYFKKYIVDTVTDADIKARYDSEIAKMPKVDEVRAKHILVKTEDEAKAIIKALTEGKDFAELAKEKSTDPSKSQGGDLGFFRKGQMVPEFESAALAMQPGTFSQTPIKTQFGFHVIKVEEKRPVAPPELDKIKEQVRQVVMRDKYIALLTGLKASTSVEIVDPALKKGYDAAQKPAK